MGRHFIFLLVIFLTASGVFAGSLEVCGDIKQGVYLESSQNLAELIENKYPATDLCLMIAQDGTAVTIDYSVFPFIEIIMRNGVWTARTEQAPKVCNLNNLVEIVLHTPLRSQISPKSGSCKTPFSIKLAKYKYVSKSYQNNLLARKYKLISDKK